MAQVITMAEKICTKCAVSKPLSDYYFDSRRNYVRPSCKDCVKKEASIHQKNTKEAQAKKQQKWRKENPEKWKEVVKRYRKNNSEIMRQRTYAWLEKNREHARNKSSEYAKKNPEKYAAQAAKRRAMLLNATPIWANFDAIQVEYALSDWCSKATGIKYHVDHIIPLQGKLVCGLHVPNNLRVIPAVDNLSKHNKFNV